MTNQYRFRGIIKALSTRICPTHSTTAVTFNPISLSVVVRNYSIGKSSLLFFVTNRYANYLHASTQYRFAYVELQDAHCKTLDGLLRTILQSLNVAPIPKVLTLAKFQDAILKLKSAECFPVVCLDEFEDLAHNTEEFKHDLYDCWRHLMNENALAFITASKDSLIDLAEAHHYTSPFFNVFTHLPLGELTDAEARELIARGANCDRPFTPTEQNDAWLLAGNHPYKLQLIGNLLYLAKADNRAVDWAELRKQFVMQLKQVGLESDVKRNLKSFGRKSKGTVKSATKSAIQELFKAWIDSWRNPRQERLQRTKPKRNGQFSHAPVRLFSHLSVVIPPRHS